MQANSCQNLLIKSVKKNYNRNQHSQEQINDDLNKITQSNNKSNNKKYKYRHRNVEHIPQRLVNKHRDMKNQYNQIINHQTNLKIKSPFKNGQNKQSYSKGLNQHYHSQSHNHKYLYKKTLINTKFQWLNKYLINQSLQLKPFGKGNSKTLKTQILMNSSYSNLKNRGFFVQENNIGQNKDSYNTTSDKWSSKYMQSSKHKFFREKNNSEMIEYKRNNRQNGYSEESKIKKSQIFRRTKKQKSHSKSIFKTEGSINEIDSQIYNNQQFLPWSQIQEHYILNRSKTKFQEKSLKKSPIIKRKTQLENELNCVQTGQKILQGQNNFDLLGEINTNTEIIRNRKEQIEKNYQLMRKQIQNSSVKALRNKKFICKQNTQKVLVLANNSKIKISKSSELKEIPSNNQKIQEQVSQHELLVNSQSRNNHQVNHLNKKAQSRGVLREQINFYQQNHHSQQKKKTPHHSKSSNIKNSRNASQSNTRSDISLQHIRHSKELAKQQEIRTKKLIGYKRNLKVKKIFLSENTLKSPVSNVTNNQNQLPMGNQQNYLLKQNKIKNKYANACSLKDKKNKNSRDLRQKSESQFLKKYQENQVFINEFNPFNKNQDFNHSHVQPWTREINEPRNMSKKKIKQYGSSNKENEEEQQSDACLRLLKIAASED